MRNTSILAFLLLLLLLGSAEANALTTYTELGSTTDNLNWVLNKDKTYRLDLSPVLALGDTPYTPAYVTLNIGSNLEGWRVLVEGSSLIEPNSFAPFGLDSLSAQQWSEVFGRGYITLRFERASASSPSLNLNSLGATVYAMNAVPLPGAMLLLASGIGGLAFVRRRML